METMRDELIEIGAKALDAMPPELQDYSSCAEVVLDAILEKMKDWQALLCEVAR